ncbi:MAG: YggS family pyridoxal phosphate-dependent enzyme [Gammaproteobacteria bacterium]|nr:YggS family pyridoxal phosphate-dependent enzyme [Gammaproteobacteria bacterium]
MQNIEQNLKKIRAEINEFEKQAKRVPDSVQLLAVSKKKSTDLIVDAYHAGQRLFGESYVQEALAKIEKLNQYSDIEWHFIGPIQSNKTRDIANHFNWVHSVDRIKIIRRLNEQRSDQLAPLNICLQVNIDAEETKSGFLADEILLVAQDVLGLKNIKLRGLMAIPKPRTDEKQQRETFHKVQQLFSAMQSLSVDVDTLSLGMSGDMSAAIAEGSSMVRIGTAIFGERDV